MKDTKKTRATSVYLCRALAIGTLLIASVIHSGAQTYNLSARNTSVQIDVGGSGAGISDWTVNGGVSQLSQQWFYYSIGGGTLSSIDNIAPWSTPTLGGSAPLGTIINTNLTEKYVNSALSLTTLYTLYSQPSGSLSASLGTSMGFQNTSGTNEVLHLFEYSDFALGGNAGEQNVNFSGSGIPYQVNQTGPNGSSLQGTLSINGGTSYTVEEAAGLADGTSFGLRTGNPAPTFGGPLSAGEGAVDYVYEIDVTLASGQGFTVSATQALAVPEPSSVALMGLGMLGLVISSRKLNFLKTAKNLR